MNRVGTVQHALRKLRPWAALAAAALAACGGGGGESSGGVAPQAPKVQGRVIDGYLVGAQVFWDCNDNFVIDSQTEPSTLSVAGGQYTIEPAPNSSCLLRAIVPRYAVDETTGRTVERQYRLSAARDNPALITPFTTLVTDGNYTVSELQRITGFSGDLRADYIAKGSAGYRDSNIAGVIATGLSAVDNAVLAAQASGRQVPYRTVLENLPQYVFVNAPTTQYSPPSFIQQVLDATPVWDSFLAGFRMPGTRFVLADVATSGLCLDAATGNAVSSDVCERRKTFVRSALALADRYKAVSGRAINWTAIPRAERVALDASAAVPLNAEVERLNADMYARIESQRAQVETLRSQMNWEGAGQLVSSYTSLALSAAAVGVSVAEKAHPAGKVAKGYKVLKGPKKIKKALANLSELGQKKNYLQFFTKPECAAAFGQTLFDTWVNAPEGSIEITQTVLTELGTVATCVFDIIGNDRYAILFGAAFSGANLSLQTWGNLSSKDERLILFKEVMALLGVVSAISDLLPVDWGLGVVADSAALGLNMAIQNMQNEVSGNKAWASFIDSLESSHRRLLPMFQDFGEMKFAARLNPYITLDVHADIQASTSTGMSAVGRMTRLDASTGRAESRSAVAVGDTLSFTPDQVAGAGGVTRYEWNFGDGSSPLVKSDASTVSHAYAQAGSYTVTLTTTSTGPAPLDGGEAEIYSGSVTTTVNIGLPLAFSDSFSGSALDPQKWRIEPCQSDYNAHPASFSIVAGQLRADVPGGSNGFMGKCSGSRLVAATGAISGDFDATVKVTEVLRQPSGSYKDNSGVLLYFGSTVIGIGGNYSGYWPGVPYNTYNKHRISAFGNGGTSTCLLDESLGLNALYSLELRIRRVNGVGTVGYRLAGAAAWSERPCPLDASGNLVLQPYSGDGGGTLSTGRVVVDIDDFLVKLPASIGTIDLTGATWTLSGTDQAGTSFAGSTIVFDSQSPRPDGGFNLSGYFYWTGSNGSFGRENFSGLVTADRTLSLNGTALIAPTARLVLGTYRAQLSLDGRSILNGSWSAAGGVASDSWSATRP